MRNNKFLKFISSLPVILISLYFIPFLGFCLILFRYFIYENNKKLKMPFTFFVIAFLTFIPKMAIFILNLIKYDINKFEILNKIVNLNIYNVNVIKYGKLLIISGVLTIILDYMFNKVSEKIGSFLGTYIRKSEEKEAEIVRKNDMEFKIRKDQANNTYCVKCPNCGADNLISGKFGICKYCRSKLKNEKYK